MEHLPGCDGNHTPRQPCSVPPAPAADPPPESDATPHPPDYRLLYCVRCGRANDATAMTCRHCMRPLSPTDAQRVTGLSYLLNEAQFGAVGEMLGKPDRERLIGHYESELVSLIAPRPVPAAVAPEPPAIAVAPEATMPQPASAGVRGGGPPAAPRKPYDWSWLAEQQANLFLFTGAFLVVVAALIYVAYSGEAVSGSLKMALLAGFTLAFLGAGVACLRIPRVVMAGQVFFGVGAVLVPITFVAAYTILSDRNLDPRSLWLAGSLTTALFYTLIATTGLGRPYAYASGAAWISAAAAVAAVAHLHAEWWLIVLIAVAILMSAAAFRAPEVFRERVGGAWLEETRVLVAAAIVTAIGIALVAAPEQSSLDLTTRWFLPLTFAAGAAYACGLVAGLRDDEAGVGAMLATCGALITVVYALHRPAEEYAIAFGALSLVLAGAVLAIEADAIGRYLPGTLSRNTRGIAIAATLAAGAVGLLIAWAGRQPDAPAALVPQTRWFALPASALILVFYAIDAGRRRRESVTGAALAIAAIGASCVYGLGASTEYYALSLTGAGAALVLLVAALPRVPSRLLHPAAGDDLRVLAHLALASGVAVALVALRVEHTPDSTYAAQTRWFLLATFASAASAYGVFVALPRGRVRFFDDARHTGLALSLTGVCAAVVYGLDASPEYYAFAFAGAAIMVFSAGWLMPARLGSAADSAWVRGNYLVVAHTTALVAGVVACAAAIASAVPDAGYEPDARAYLPALFTTLAAFYALCVASRKTAPEWEALAPLGFVASVIGVAAGVVYALQASPEYYAFAFLVPAAALALAARVRLPRAVAGLLPDGWVDGAFGVARIAVTTGVAIAVVAALVAAPANASYQPDTRAYLPLAFLAAALPLAFDASRGRQWSTSAAFLVVLAGAAVAMPYALDTDRVYYAVAFAGVGLIYGLGGRAWSPGWLDREARDVVAAIAVTTAWLPFEGAFADAARIGAGVHFAATAYYAIVALTARRGRTLDDFGDGFGPAGSVPLATGWLYAAGLAGGIGYVHLWRALGEGEGAPALAYPLLGLALGFLAVSASARYWRRDFGIHLYVLSLVASAAALACARDAGVLAVQLSSLAAAYLAVSVWEDAPMLGMPAVAAGFGAIAAWQQALDAPEYVIPLAYGAIAIVLYATGFALHRSARAWSDAARAAASVYALVGPLAGFAILAVRTHSGALQGGAFERSALYQCSTLAVAAVGVLAVVESSIARRGWVVVAGTAVLAVALLLEIGRFHPGSAQPYTATAGVYLVLLGIVGVSGFRVIAARDDVAQVIDAAGATIVMAPSIVQAFAGGWAYVALLLAEAALFFTLGVTLRRRLLVGVALATLLGVVIRVLFDAVNALPNWIVVLLAGMALLGIGTGILVGRERWGRWQDRILSWWDEGGAPRAQAP